MKGTIKVVIVELAKVAMFALFFTAVVAAFMLLGGKG